MYDPTGGHRCHHLRDVGQPREGACEPDPLEVGAELRLARGYGRSGSGCDLASRGSMARTLSNPDIHGLLAVRNLRARRFRTVHRLQRMQTVGKLCEAGEPRTRTRIAVIQVIEVSEPGSVV